MLRALCSNGSLLVYARLSLSLRILTAELGALGLVGSVQTLERFSSNQIRRAALSAGTGLELIQLKLIDLTNPRIGVWGAVYSQKA